MAERMDDVDWSGLFHALGPASDTPRHLKALLGEDARAFVDGYSHLWSVTMRPDGRAWPATAPTALLVVELLDDPMLGPDDPSMRDAMLAYLYRVGVVADLGGEAAEIRNRAEARGLELRGWTAEYLSADAERRAGMWEDGTGLGELVLDQAAVACFAVVPGVLERVTPRLDSARARHRVCAAAAVGTLAQHPSALAQRPALVQRLAEMAAVADSSYDLATILMAIGQLGGDTRPWLSNPHAGVRGCAALAPELAGDEAATRVLRELALFPRAFGESFGDMAPPLQFQAKPYQDLLGRGLVWRGNGAGTERGGNTVKGARSQVRNRDRK